MSPAIDSIAKSSLSVPMNVSSGSRMTRKSAISGIAPPDVCASSRLPRRPRSIALTSSRWMSAARRPRLVENPSDDMLRTASNSRAGRSRYGHAPRTSANISSSRTRRTPSRRRSAAPGRRAARRAATIASSSPRRTERSSAAHSIESSRDVGNTRPLGSAGDACVRSGRRAAAASQSGAAIQSGRRDPRVRCRSRARAMPSRRARAAARLEPRLRVEARLLREASVMRSDRVVAEPVAQVTGQSLGHPSRVHEDERRPVRLDQSREPLVVLIPDFVRHHRFERRAGNLDAQIHRRGDDPCRRSCTGSPDVPTRKRPTSSIGFCVADRPMR